MSKIGRMIYLSRCYRDLSSAGNKAKTDNEATMQAMGFVNVGLPQQVGANGVFIFFYDLASVLKACCSIRRGDVFLLQYPVKKYFSLLCRIAHLRGAKVMTIIHDLGSFRRRKLTVDAEIRRLSHADCVIASNCAMEKWLRENGLKVSTVSLGLFDYRSPSSAMGSHGLRHDSEDGVLADGHCAAGKPFYRVVYAGSLSMRKNAFFLSLPSVISGFECHVYGNGDAMPSLKEDNRIVFHGFAPADDFIANCVGDFGLVWDGDSLDSCTGFYGEYLRYNSPHKASFYLRAGLPVIVWKDAAIAPIIEQEKIGFAISSINELPSMLAKITVSDYDAMRQRVLEVADRLNAGGSFMKAVGEACDALSLG